MIPARLRQKREELGVSVERLAKIVSRHRSYIEEIESGRIPLVWERDGETLWSHLIEIQLSRGQTAPLSKALEAPHGKRSRADLLDEIKQLREIRTLTEQSAWWEELATTRADLIRELRIDLGGNPDADDLD